MASIQDGPHYEVSSVDFAEWLEQQAAESWWNLDGESLLIFRLSTPCPTDELAIELRKLNRPLLIEAKGRPDAKGQVIDAARIGTLAMVESLTSINPQVPWLDERYFRMCWKGSPQDWFLIEDTLTAQEYREEARLMEN